MGAATDMTLPHPRFNPAEDAPDEEWDAHLITCMTQDRTNDLTPGANQTWLSSQPASTKMPSPKPKAT